MADPVSQASLVPARILPAVAGLPVLDILAGLAEALARSRRALVQAPPGAGKTTVIPLSLLYQAGQTWLKNKKILVLEPRRLAARACAQRMAALLGEKPGQTVGYQVRLERCVGPETRIEVITEGILTRRIQGDPELAGVGLLIFDEFHERHLHSDLGLALALDAAGAFCPDLRLLVMSATMDMDRLAKVMGEAPVIESQGRSWPVETVYLPPAAIRSPSGYRSSDRGFEILPACRAAIARALAEQEGDILVFLPGAAQIRTLAGDLAPTGPDDAGPETGKRVPLSVYPLFGNLSPKDQAAAIAPSRPGGRKIVLATPIAETSLTIEGVRVVVDSGLARVPRFSPKTGMSRLETLPVSKASADQRRGRAGRTGPGVCFRLWSEHEHQGLIPFNRPEILQVDLAPLALELALWGVSDPGDLQWLDPPPQGALALARELLTRLGALDAQGRITALGRRLAEAGIHPRLAKMVLAGKKLGQGFTACCLAAIAENRDVGHGSADPDVRQRLEILAGLARGRQPDRQTRVAAGFVLDQAVHLASRFGIPTGKVDPHAACRLLALAWPERIARKREGQDRSYLMASGSGCAFFTDNALSGTEFIVALHVGGSPKNPLVSLAAPYDRSDLEQDFSDQILVRETVAWDPRTRSVRALATRTFMALVLDESPCPLPGPEVTGPALVQGIAREGVSLLPWSRQARSLCDRVNFLRQAGLGEKEFDALPDFSESALIQTLDQWLLPFIGGISSGAALKNIDLAGALLARLSWDQQRLVEAQAPTHLQVPSGSNLPLAYADDTGPLASPVLAVRLQEMFGQTATPTVARGRVPVTLHLLSPAGRPVQITRDLANFWQSTYKAVKKDLMGRYPKHFWPDDPLAAAATARAKPRKK